MKISTKTRYGMRFMLDLAQHASEGCIPMKDIAERQGISKKYLEQAVSPLSAAGLLNVTRGNKGGFQLAKPAFEISLADVVRASEDGLDLMDCIGCIMVCDHEGSCASREVWGGMQKAITDYLEGRTLEDVIDSLDSTSQSSSGPTEAPEVATLL